MVAAVKADNFIKALVNKEIDVFGTTDTFKIAICTDAMDAANDD